VILMFNIFALAIGVAVDHKAYGTAAFTFSLLVGWMFQFVRDDIRDICKDNGKGKGEGD